MEGLRHILQIEILKELTVISLLGAFLAIFLGFVLKRVMDVVISRLVKMVEGTKNILDDILLNSIVKPVRWACIVAGFYLALKILPIPEEPLNLQRFFDALLKGATVFLLIWIVIGILDGLADVWKKRAERTETRLDDQIIPIVHRSGRAFLILLGVVLVLQNLGYSVGSLLAGIGLGGAALALASKDTVANLFGSIVIFLDRPFQMGDWIEMGDMEGTVEEVGLRTTRIRTFANSLVSLPNSLFTTTPVNNWSRMKKRRIKMTVGLTYSTTPDEMERAVEKIREIIMSDPNIHHDFFLVNFDNLGPYSLDIFIYCFTVSTNWAEYLNARQKLIIDIMRGIKEIGLEFAFPTQTIHVESLPGEQSGLKRERPS